MKSFPIALTLAGSDSGGGAGIQADLKVFQALNVHGVSAITCLTAQNPVEVKSVQASTPAFLKSQLEAVFEELRPNAMKSGMLFSADLIDVIADFLDGVEMERIPWVLDPVLVATSGARLLEFDAESVMVKRLFPKCALLTPNLDEALELLKIRPEERPETLEALTRDFFDRFQRPTLLKGGHWDLKNERSERIAQDCFFDGEHLEMFEAPWIPNVSTHGSGCSFSAAIAARLAQGDGLRDAVAKAKTFMTGMIQTSYKIRSHTALNPNGAVSAHLAS